MGQDATVGKQEPHEREHINDCFEPFMPPVCPPHRIKLLLQLSQQRPPLLPARVTAATLLAALGGQQRRQLVPGIQQEGSQAPRLAPPKPVRQGIKESLLCSRPHHCVQGFLSDRLIYQAQLGAACVCCGEGGCPPPCFHASRQLCCALAC